MSDRPTFDDIRREQESFIGPPEPPTGAKMPRKLTKADEVNAATLVTLSIIRRALRAGQPIDPKHLPERVVEILEANCVCSKMLWRMVGRITRLMMSSRRWTFSKVRQPVNSPMSLVTQKGG